MGLTVPLIDRPLLKDVAAGASPTSPGVDVAGCANLCFYAVGSAGVSAGAVIIEESHDIAYAGAWTPIGAAITFIVGVAVPVRLAGTAKAVRARITTPVTGGTASVYIVGR